MNKICLNQCSFVWPGMNYVNATKSWAEQRNMTYLSIDALGNHSVVKEIWKEMEALQAQRPALEGTILWV